MNESNPIISLSTPAIQHVKKMLEQYHKNGFRLSIKKSGCTGFSYIVDVVDQPQENDEQFKQDDLPIFVDKESISYIQGTLIDISDKGLGQKQLTFNNPNVESLCGCGESFNVKNSLQKSA